MCGCGKSTTVVQTPQDALTASQIREAASAATDDQTRRSQEAALKNARQ